MCLAPSAVRFSDPAITLPSARHIPPPPFPALLSIPATTHHTPHCLPLSPAITVTPNQHHISRIIVIIPPSNPRSRRQSLDITPPYATRISDQPVTPQPQTPPIRKERRDVMRQLLLLAHELLSFVPVLMKDICCNLNEPLHHISDVDVMPNGDRVRTAYLS